MAEENKLEEKIEEKSSLLEKETSERKKEKEIAGAEKPAEEVSEKRRKEVKEEEKTLKKEKKKEETTISKTEAVVYGKDLRISKKHAVAICNFIRGRKIEEAVFLLQEVSQMKRAVPMRGEIPHRKGMMSGRYPIKAAEQFLKLLKQLSANASANGLDLDKGKIECRADRASRPYKRFGSERFKRTHVILRLRIQKEKKPREKNKE